MAGMIKNTIPKNSKILVQFLNPQKLEQELNKISKDGYTINAIAFETDVYIVIAYKKLPKEWFPSSPTH